MKKVLILLILITAGFTQLRAAYFDFGISDTPMLIGGRDRLNNVTYFFFNYAQFRASLNFNDNFSIRFRLTDTFSMYTNSYVSNSTASVFTNKIYVDRLFLKFTSDKFKFTLGREIFSEADGMVLGNLSDGLQLSGRLLGLEERAYVMYSGLLPQDVNQFNVTAMDRTEGSKRLQTGLYLEKYGILVRSMSLGYLYSADISTNTQLYSPHFLSLNLNGDAGKIVSYSGSFTYGLGTFGSNVNISALAFDVQLKVKFNPMLSMLVRFAYASGENTNSTTTNSYERYNALGIYNTGQILVPDFANLILTHLALNASLLNEKLNLGLNLLYLNRPSTSDSLNGFYTGTGSYIGTEVSLGAVWRFDPNISLLLNTGYFWRENSDAFLAGSNDRRDIYKIIAGIQFNL